MTVSEVLIVDDDASTRELLAAIVGRHSRHAVQCADGRSARALLQSREYDAIVLDLVLPEVSGLELLADLGAAKPPRLSRVVVITAATPSLWDGCAEMADVQAVVRKPFDVADLDAALMRCWTPRHS